MTLNEDKVLAGLLNTLLPGGSGFPSANATGMSDLLAVRLRAANPKLLEQLCDALSARGALPEAAVDWREAIARLEAVEPELFDEVRKYAYLTYYEQPETIAAIRALGFRYNDAPLPEGYSAEHSEAAWDGPRHGRGRWTPTTEVRRVDISQLDLEELR